MILRHVWSGLALAAVLLAAGCCCHKPREACAPPCGPAPCCGAPGAVAPGQMHAFTAGGVLGYLVNDGQRLYALSALCTHMGCRLKPTQGAMGLRCLCHGARFSATGTVLAGPAAQPLPRLALQAVGGRIYVRGTVEEA